MIANEFAPVIGHTATELAQRQREHALRQYGLALVHGFFWGASANKPTVGLSKFQSRPDSNTKFGEQIINHDVLM